MIRILDDTVEFWFILLGAIFKTKVRTVSASRGGHRLVVPAVMKSGRSSDGAADGAVLGKGCR